jgi:hypothetical protein
MSDSISRDNSFGNERRLTNHHLVVTVSLTKHRFCSTSGICQVFMYGLVVSKPKYRQTERAIKHMVWLSVILQPTMQHVFWEGCIPYNYQYVIGIHKNLNLVWPHLPYFDIKLSFDWLISHWSLSPLILFYDPVWKDRWLAAASDVLLASVYLTNHLYR